MINLTYRYMYLVSVLGKEGVGGGGRIWNEMFLVSSGSWCCVLSNWLCKLYLSKSFWVGVWNDVFITTVEHLLTQPPRLIRPLTQTKAQWVLFFYLENLFNMLLLLIQSDFCCLMVTRLTGFHCNLLFFRIFVPHGGKTEFELTHITKFSYVLKVI